MSAVGKSKHLLQQLLFGLEQATFEAVEELDKIVAEKYEAVADLNDKKIQLKCSEVQRRKEVCVLMHTVEPPLKDSLNKGHLTNIGQDLEHQKVTFL